MTLDLEVLLNEIGKHWENETPEIKKLWIDREEYIVQGIEYYFANNQLPKLGFKPEGIKLNENLKSGQSENPAPSEAVSNRTEPMDHSAL